MLYIGLIKLQIVHNDQHHRAGVVCMTKQTVSETLILSSLLLTLFLFNVYYTVVNRTYCWLKGIIVVIAIAWTYFTYTGLIAGRVHVRVGLGRVQKV